MINGVWNLQKVHTPKEMASENKQSMNMQNKSTVTKGVVITVYVESTRTRSIKPSEDPKKKTKSHYRMPQTTGSQSSQGYDRRAQLLAYSRQLRETAESQKNVKVRLPHNQSRPRSKASSRFSSLATNWFSSHAKNM
ncbi:unnamed protein product [Sphenostylis stenocarpa]|uniref:Uncharacterized protein n=1 Tax=Sphenostylis stenocarpa TaxID=92480 RepID=A0AA86VNK5_9FABA|nr:unnamed protein product [Sphenostylis stenocarpa]